MGIRAIVRKLTGAMQGHDEARQGAVAIHQLGDDKKLLADLHAQTWEEHYLRRESGMDTGKAFLPELDSLDSDFANALSGQDIRSGRLLEIGAGSGSQAILYARMGFAVTATDVSGTAVGQAQALASRQGAHIEFVKDNILYTALDGQFDIIADRGCYTVLPQDCLDLYAANVSRLLRRGGFLLLKLDQRRKDRMEILRRHFDVVSSADGHYQDGKVEDSSLRPAIFLTLRHGSSTGGRDGSSE